MTKWLSDQSDLRTAIESRIPVGRAAKPGDIAEVAALPASGRMSNVAGHGLVESGGWTTK